MRIIRSISVVYLSVICYGCNKLTEVPPPKNSITQTNVFTSDATAIAVMTGMYTSMVQNNVYSGNNCISSYCGLSADELSIWSGNNNSAKLAYYQNNLRLVSSTTYYGSEFWSPIYAYIFICNSTIEQLNGSTSGTISSIVKKQVIGVDKFMRAFHYFYLVNLFGDVPLILKTDYAVNNVMPRTAKQIVWQQIVSDLKDAEQLLSKDYLDPTFSTTTIERVRPTSWAATALLARAYLYTGNYAEAEQKASVVINNSTLFGLVTPLDNVFLRNSKEAIWQLQPVGAAGLINTLDGYYLSVPPTGPTVTFTYSINPTLFNTFEAGDSRKTNWINSVLSNSVYFPYKYKQRTLGTPNSSNQTEYLMVLRIGEQLLIRAEARARQNHISDAVADLNMIRARARAVPTSSVPTPLPDLSGLLSQLQTLQAVAHERQVELFSEWGHRWLDLKRTNAVDSVMIKQTPLKTNANGNISPTWNSYQQLYPILPGDIISDPNLTQNIGF